MKVFVFLLAVSAACAFPESLLAPGLPMEEGPGEEFMPVIDNKEWAMVPDAQGKFHIVNVNEALNQEPENFFNPETDVHFLLFTQSNPTNGQTVIRNNAASLANSNFNPSHPTRFLIHGWNGSPGAASNTLARAAFMQRGNFNVFVVDWSAGAQTINYITARNRVGPTGAIVGNFIHFIVNSGGAQRAHISVIGHSLGAHVAGFAGKNHPPPNQLASVVGLDPAWPLFSADDTTTRMDRGDAAFVESSHTNAGVLGFTVPIGDATYYPNGGSSQPGCGIDVSGACAHARSNHFYAESINTNTHFYAVLCPGGYDQILAGTCPQTGASRRKSGEPLDPSQHGVFWLPTNSASPFAMGRI
ncbi:pancreatic triacylglycerol lipase-like [Phlebotomus argentipes]|uniref:pancreatic triacylglycerol lipase-like n=1 Tax=Phlebotomus argentipes TaxID=94469 RepID=UPI00289337C1|nr:pancreatic triacylglycerol lipase-like [Phlebotomus argentipes]